MRKQTAISMCVVAAVMLGAAAPALAATFEPTGLYLTWQRDPTRTMTIDWQLTPEQHADTTRRSIEYREEGARDWQREAGDPRAFPFSDRTIKRVELIDLQPGTVYQFRFGSDSRIYKFRTMPTDASRPIRFASGGDTRTRQEWMEGSNRQAMQFDLDFVVWGGDLAYANGQERFVENWYEWFDAIMNTLITDDGRVVPIIVAIGNHEMRRGFYFNRSEYEPTAEWRESIAPYFYSLFAFPGHPGYGVLDFGEYLSLIILDTDHTNPVEGEQAEWLEGVLSDRQDVTHRIPVYHVPAFPSHRGYGTKTSQHVLHNWVPLFEQYGVRIAFEHHDHAYKRTHPIHEAQVIQPDDRDPDAEYKWVSGGIHSMIGHICPTHGIVYVGDGCWGVGTREINNTPENTWYMAEARSVQHVIIVTLHNAHQHLLMIDIDGRVIDEYPETPWRMRPQLEIAEPVEPAE